ncbi:glycosyltransferase, partial [Leisingera sp. JC11]|uniref:glycosyltransferase n=1 Tax=Leisingera sp. JC11 TaxID=3042469 RepID=UPI0034540CC0
MYVLHVVSDLDEAYGGPSQSVPQLVHHLAAEGVGGRILYVETLAQSRNRIVESRQLLAQGARIRGSRRICYAPDLRRLLREAVRSSAPALVHIHSMWRYNAWAAWQEARAAGLPVVVSPRSNLYGHSLRKNRLIKQAARRLFVDRMLTEAAFVHATAASETEAVRAAGYKTVPVRTIPNGIDPVDVSGFATRAAALSALQLETDPARPHVLFLSRVDPRKRVADLIAAFAASEQARSQAAELLIAGPAASEGYAADLRARAAAEGVAERVHLLGMLRDGQRTAAYAAADVFALPTQFENFGIAIGEALSAGLPVVTTTATPWAAAAENGVGHLVEPGDTGGLAAGLDRFLLALPA